MSPPPDAAPLLALDQDELAAVVGPPEYRPRQVWRWLYEAGVGSVEEMTDLPRALRERLGARGVGFLDPVEERHGDRGMTVKWLYASSGGSRFETVLMRYPTRATVCVSSQAGCAQGCPFCATGQGGFERQLHAGEIVEQVLRARRWLRDSVPDSAEGEAGATRVSNVVYMGMGEPLANYEAVLRSLHTLHADVGLSARSLTVSTIGIPARIRSLATDAPPVTLAWSVHAADDELRDRLVPPNRRWPIGDVVDALHDYRRAGGRRITIEYTLMDGINDRPDQAGALAGLTRGLRAHVNVIRMNPTADPAYQPSTPEAVRRFMDALAAAGANATLRRNRGTDIEGACGQLRAVHVPLRSRR